MSGPPPRLPVGTTEHPPESAKRLLEAEDVVNTLFSQRGFDPVLTPLFEIESVLRRGLGRATERAAMRMIDPESGEVVILRPDFTAQVARMAAGRLKDRPRPLRLRYAGRIVRARDPFGRGLENREVFQCGVELIGAAGPEADMEVLSLAADAIAEVDGAPTLALSHAALLDALLPDGADKEAIGRALLRKDAAALRALAPSAAPLVDLYGGVEVLGRARHALSGPAAVHDALDALEDLHQRLAAGFPLLTITYDLAEERGLGYYTGAFFRAYVEGAADAVLIGGRYDDLLGHFGAPEPAVGFGLDLGALVR